MKIQPNYIIHNYQCIEAGNKLEGQRYSAHEIGAHENLDGFTKATEDNQGDLKVVHQIRRHSKSPGENADKLINLGMSTGLLIGFANPLLGLGMTARRTAAIS